VLKTQGRRGEVAVELHTDFPERFAERREIHALEPGGTRRQLQLEDFWPHLGYFILKFRGVDSISDAEHLVGCELQIPAAERAPLEPGAAYVSDLVGCTLWDMAADRHASEIGAITGVQFGAGEAPLLVVRSRNKEFLIPFAAAYLRGVDLPGRRVEMALPEGLLEVDAPLTEEEKKRQRGES
jgi:16S rRNA processing protein RimM